MLLSKALAGAILAITTGSDAAPTILERAVQSCTCSDRGIAIGAYGVYIGITYANGIGCNNVYHALTNADPNPLISNWQCVAAGDGNTQLYFNAALYRAAGINSALHSQYPTVNGFNCPDY